MTPPKWWSITVLSVVAAGVLSIGVGRVIEQNTTPTYVPAAKSATVGKPSGKLHLPSHGPLPSYIAPYTGPTNPPLQSPFTPTSSPLPSPSPPKRTHTPRPSNTASTSTGTPSPTTLPPTPTPTPTLIIPPSPEQSSTDTSGPFITSTASP